MFRLSGKDSSLSKWYRHMLEFDDFIITEDIYNKAAILKVTLRFREALPYSMMIVHSIS